MFEGIDSIDDDTSRLFEDNDNDNNNESPSSIRRKGIRSSEDVFADEDDDAAVAAGAGDNKSNSSGNGSGGTTGVGRFLETGCGSTTVRALIGLGIAGLGGTLVADAFGMFYVDCFLRSYRLPPRVFGIGSAVFAVINTANDVAGAYLCDRYAAGAPGNNRREDLVGLSGCLFAVSLLLPFFRWGPPRAPFWDGLHFVGSLSVYDTMFSFNCILQGSIVSDNHSMTDRQRIAFFAARDLVGIVAPLVVTKIGLGLFDAGNLRPFRIYCIVLVAVSCLLCTWGQALIAPGVLGGFGGLPAWLGGGRRSGSSSSTTGYAKVAAAATTTTTTTAITDVEGDREPGNHDDDGDRLRDGPNVTTAATGNDRGHADALGFRRVVSDFAAHPNFRYWIGMEMLMEGQNTFLGNFQKTFVDQLILRADDVDGDESGGGWSREACDWLLALLDPATQIVGLLLFLPIRRYGYARLYRVVFATNALLAVGLLVSNGFGNNNNNDGGSGGGTTAIAAFLVAAVVGSNAMAGAGFGLAMCDMVLEMKHAHTVVERRPNPASMAGLFMGVNALFCKPAESVLPILAASFLGEGYSDADAADAAGDDGAAVATGLDHSAKTVLYRLLVFPPLVCSVLQALLWSRYSLVPETTERLRAELREHEDRGNGNGNGNGSIGVPPSEASETADRGIELHPLA